jgi:hypothetical protein
VHCRDHEDALKVLLSGHVLRVHPETIPSEKFDEMLRDEAVMSEIRRSAEKSPGLWKDFFEYVERFQRGEVPEAPPMDAGLVERGAGYRAKAMRERGQMVRWYDGSWSFLLSCGIGEPGGAEAVPMWIFSAQLYPQGRGSTEKDWEDLGRWSAVVGVPPGQVAMGNTVLTSPNAVHKWIWVDDKPRKARTVH